MVTPRKGEMFKKTREKIEEKYIRPAQDGIAIAIVLSMLAFIGSILAIMIASAGVTANAV
jgi:hypothetical protein